MTRRAEIHNGATLTPTKRELVVDWLARQDWFTGDPAVIEQVAAFRFVDPEGEVGIETLLFNADGFVFQIPQTYRAEPLDDDVEGLIGVLEHSELGTRYVYDAMTDPVYLAELERVIREGDTAVETVSLRDGSVKPAGMEVRGTGVAEGVATVGELEVVGLLTDERYEDAPGRLLGRLVDDAGTREVVLAVLR